MSLAENQNSELFCTSASDLSAGRRRWFYALPIFFLVFAAFALAIDFPLAQWCKERPRLGGFHKVLDLTEVYGHGFGVVLAALFVFQLDPKRRWVIPRLLVLPLGAGLLVDGMKITLARTRPFAFDFHGNVWHTFGDWFPSCHLGSNYQSFPSGHTATAVALAITLAWIYPRGRWLFVTLAVMVAGQRVFGAAHYLSDVLFSAAVGSALAIARLYVPWLSQRLDRLEVYCHNLFCAKDNPH
jgi:membrane-associated phospholipid phosphatase